MHVTFHTGLHSGMDVRWRHDKIYLENEEMIVAVNAIYAIISHIINKIYFENHIFLPIVRSCRAST